MSKTTPEKSAVENSTQDDVSNTSKPEARSTSQTRRTSRTSSAADSSTAKKSTEATAKPKRASSRAKTASAGTQAKSSANTSASKKTSAQQDRIMSQTSIRRVAIIGGNRIPFARSNGAYFKASNIDMLTAALNGLVERYKLQGTRVAKWLQALF